MLGELNTLADKNKKLTEEIHLRRQLQQKLTLFSKRQ